MHGPHAAAATSRDRLQHCCAIGSQSFQECATLVERHCVIEAAQNGNAALFRQGTCLGLVAEACESFRAGPDEDEPSPFACGSEFTDLAQESVARVNCLATLLLGDPDNCCCVQVGRHPGCLEVDS